MRAENFKFRGASKYIDQDQRSKFTILRTISALMASR